MSRLKTTRITLCFFLSALACRAFAADATAWLDEPLRIIQVNLPIADSDKIDADEVMRCIREALHDNAVTFNAGGIYHEQHIRVDTAGVIARIHAEAMRHFYGSSTTTPKLWISSGIYHPRWESFSRGELLWGGDSQVVDVNDQRVRARVIGHDATIIKSL